MSKVKIPKHTEQVLPQVENLLKSWTLISLLICSFFLTQISMENIDKTWVSNSVYLYLSWFIKGILILVLGTFNTILIMGLGILGHEGTHWTLFKNRFLNDFWGGILWALSLLPYYNFRDFHFTHHRCTHYQVVDPEEPMNNHPLWFALTLGLLMGLMNRYKIVLSHLVSQSAKERGEAWKDVGFLTLAIVFYFYLIPLLGISIWFTVIPTFVILPTVFALRNIGEHHSIPEQGQQTLTQGTQKVDSWMVMTHPLIDWLWSHINYHQVHHRYPHLSHKYLPEIFEATKAEQSYLVINRYWQIILHALTSDYYGSQEDIEPYFLSK